VCNHFFLFQELLDNSSKKYYHANMSSEYDEGYDAYRDGEGLQDNPYREATSDHDDWEAGWLEAASRDAS